MEVQCVHMKVQCVTSLRCDLPTPHVPSSIASLQGLICTEMMSASPPTETSSAPICCADPYDTGESWPDVNCWEEETALLPLACKITEDRWLHKYHNKIQGCTRYAHAESHSRSHGSTSRPPNKGRGRATCPLPTSVERIGSCPTYPK